MADLVGTQVEASISMSQKFKRSIGWTIEDIIGIPLAIHTHKIHLEPNNIPSIEHHRRLNPSMKEVIKKEIIKWIDNGVVFPYIY